MMRDNRKKSEEISEKSAQILIFCPIESRGDKALGEPLTFSACSEGRQQKNSYHPRLRPFRRVKDARKKIEIVKKFQKIA